VANKSSKSKSAAKAPKKAAKAPPPSSKKNSGSTSALLPALVKTHEETLPAAVDSRTEALQAYIASIKRHPLLSPERELEVAKKAFDHKDQEAIQVLILSNLRLVVKIAYDYVRSGFHVLDLIQEGNVGLLRAVKDYNPYRGVKFSSYASHWIKAYIRSFVLSNWSLVKMGTTRAQRTLFYRLQKEKAKLEALGLDAQPKALAARLDVKEKDVIDMNQRLSGKDVSLSAPLKASEEDGDSLLNFLSDKSESTDEKLAQSELQENFNERLNAFERTLSGKELIIFRERLRAETPKTLQEIGDLYQISRERVRQIEARLLEKMKEYMKQDPRLRENIIDIKPTSF
jgi:RNA polymerase sigma-32 factor